MAPRFDFVWPAFGSATVVLEVEWRGAPGSDARDRCSNLVEAFCSCGACGGFPVSGITPQQSSLRLQVSSPIDQAAHSYVLTAHNVDKACLGILANLILSMSQCIPPIDRVKLDPVASQSAGVRVPILEPTFTDVGDYYPSGASAYSYIIEVDDEAIDVHKYRHCLIMADQAFDEPQIIELEARVSSWIALLEAGGFALPVRRPSDAVVISRSLELYAPDTLEFTIPVFEASEQAWLVLFSILERAHSEIVPIKGLWLS